MAISIPANAPPPLPQTPVQVEALALREGQVVEARVVGAGAGGNTQLNINGQLVDAALSVRLKPDVLIQLLVQGSGTNTKLTVLPQPSLAQSQPAVPAQPGAQPTQVVTQPGSNIAPAQTSANATPQGQVPSQPVTTQTTASQAATVSARPTVVPVPLSTAPTQAATPQASNVAASSSGVAGSTQTSPVSSQLEPGTVFRVQIQGSGTTARPVLVPVTNPNTASSSNQAAPQNIIPLTETLPGDLNRVFFSDNGSTAVEVALKLSYQYHRNKGAAERVEFFAFEGGYHGDTLGAMSAGRGSDFFTLFQELMCTVHPIPYANTWEGDNSVEDREADALKAFAKLLDSHGKKAAAIILEPLMQGASGFRFSRPEFVRQISDMAREAGLLVIYDEVATGFGRTGTLFACEQIGFVPDIICLSKGLTAGVLPMAVTVARDEVFDAFLSDKFDTALAHGHTFTANPLACAVALTSLKIFNEEKSLERVAHINERNREQMARLQEHPRAEHARAMGCMLAFEIAGSEGHYKTQDGERLRDWYLNNGLNIRPLGPTVYLMPPYCITDDELTRAYDGLFEGLDSL